MPNGWGLTRDRLESELAESAGISKSQAKGAVDAIFNVIAEALAEGKEVRLAGFGTFKVARRSARIGRNPRTGEQIQIPARNVVRFKTAKKLRDALN